METEREGDFEDPGPSQAKPRQDRGGGNPERRERVTTGWDEGGMDENVPLRAKMAGGRLESSLFPRTTRPGNETADQGRYLHANQRTGETSQRGKGRWRN